MILFFPAPGSLRFRKFWVSVFFFVLFSFSLPITVFLSFFPKSQGGAGQLGGLGGRLRSPPKISWRMPAVDFKSAVDTADLALV